MDNKLELKKIKVLESRSEETFCYSATVYFNGKAVAEVGNSGQGGPDDCYPINDGMKSLNEHINSLPQYEFYGKMFDQDLEGLCSNLIENHLVKKDLQKLCRKWCVYFGDFTGKYLAFDKKHSQDAITKHCEGHADFKNNNIHFVNDLTLLEYKDVVSA